MICFTRYVVGLFLVDIDLTPIEGSPIVLIIEAYVKIAIPIERMPIFSGPNVLARYVIAIRPIRRELISALPIDNIFIEKIIKYL